jgi:hypothetical protein
MDQVSKYPDLGQYVNFVLTFEYVFILAKLFSSVNSDQNHLFPPVTDSSGVWTPDHRSHMCIPEGQEFALRQEVRIHCQMRSIQQSRARMQWQFMQSMQPSWFKWRRQTETRSKRCSSRRNFGLPDCNQSSLNSDIWPQTAMSTFLRPFRAQMNEYSPAVVVLSETHTASETGHLIMNVVATDAFPSQRYAFLRVLCHLPNVVLCSRESLSWPLLLSQGMQGPIIDYTPSKICDLWTKPKISTLSLCGSMWRDKAASSN